MYYRGHMKTTYLSRIIGRINSTFDESMLFFKCQLSPCSLVLDYSVINSQDLTYEHLSILPNHDDETNPVLPFSIIPQHSAPGFGKFIMIVKNVIKGCYYNYLNPPFIPS